MEEGKGKSDLTHHLMRSTGLFDTRMEVEDDMNDKENRPAALDTGNDRMDLKTERSRKDDFAKVRKSLAWNNAFFTEEGVLDSTELSLLNGSVEKKNSCLLLRKNEGQIASPFSSSKRIRGNISRLQSIEEIPGTGPQTRSRNKDRKPGGLLSDANSVTSARTPAHPIHGSFQQKGKIMEDKTSCKSTQRPPSANSQKRISNSCVANPAPKIPKLKGGNSSISGSLKNVCRASSTSKITQTVQPYKCQTGLQHAGARTKTALKHSSSKYDSALAFPPKPPRPTNLAPSPDSFQRKTNKATIAENVCCPGPSSGCSAKPSALRKPTPSLGFFLQRNNSKSDAVMELRTSYIPDEQSRSTKGLNAASTSSSSIVQPCMNGLLKPSAGSRSLKRSITTQTPVCKISERTTEHVLDGKFQYSKECKSAKSSCTSSISCSMNHDVKSSGKPESLTDSLPDENFKDQMSVDDNLLKKGERQILNSAKPVNKYSRFDLRKANTSLELIGSEMDGFSTDTLYSLSHADGEEITILDTTPCSSGANSSGVDMPNHGLTAAVNGDIIRSFVTEDVNGIAARKVDLACHEKPHDTTNTLSSEEVMANLRDDQSMTISKGKPLPLQCQLKAEPFTDEWIAAVEAFGEDILKRKGGAVQNSPTEKIIPDPSPWSPVKRKNQDVGPYDCTKYIKLPSSSRHA